MADFKTKHYIASKAICEICNVPIPYLEFLDQAMENSLVCKSFECRRIISRKESNPFEFKLRSGAYQNAVNSRQEKIAYIEEIEKRELSENQLILQSVMETPPGNIERPSHVVSVPTGLSVLQSVGEDRIATYRAHLEAAINEVYSDEASEEPVDPDSNSAERAEASTEESLENPSLKAIREQLCGICKGGCCKGGANQAYISSATIERVRETLPEHSAEDILDEYMSRIGDKTAEGSCINQTQTGCGLPRSLRSDTCNNFFCPDLHKLGDKIDTGRSQNSVLVVKRKNLLFRNRLDISGENEITGIFIAQEDNVQQIDIKPLAE